MKSVENILRYLFAGWVGRIQSTWPCGIACLMMREHHLSNELKLIATVPYKEFQDSEYYSLPFTHWQSETVLGDKDIYRPKGYPILRLVAKAFGLAKLSK